MEKRSTALLLISVNGMVLFMAQDSLGIRYKEVKGHARKVAFLVDTIVEKVAFYLKGCITIGDFQDTLIELTHCRIYIPIRRLFGTPRVRWRRGNIVVFHKI